MTNRTLDPGFTSTDECNHAEYGLRRRIYANGVTHFVYQCLRCGASGRSLKKEAAMEIGGVVAPMFDDALRDAFYEEQRSRRRAEWASTREERKAEYAEYLKSPEWRRRRERRLAMDRWQCQARLDGCLNAASEVHHLTYDHVGNEPLFDLVSVCDSCHRQISVMDGRIGDEVVSHAAD